MDLTLENKDLKIKPNRKPGNPDGQGYYFADEFLCPDCGEIVGYDCVTFIVKLTDKLHKCKNCGRKIKW